MASFLHRESSAQRVIKWETSEGEKAELLGSDRLKYWEMNKEGGEAALERLGISRATPPPLATSSFDTPNPKVFRQYARLRSM